MNKLQQLDYITIIIYMVLMAGIGLFLGKYIKNISDYFKGGSGVSWVAGGISNFMTKFSTFVFVAYAGIAYSDGMVAITLMWSTILPSLIAVFVYAKLWKRAGIISPVEFLETRYNAPIRQVFSWSGVFLKLLDDMIKLYSIGIFVTAASGIPFQTAVIYCGLVVAVYTVVGGFLAVIVTDVVQFVILFFSTLILVPLAYNAAGGLSNMQRVIPENMSFFNGHRGVPFFLLVYYLTIIIKYLGNWTFIQRFYSARSEEDGKKIGWLSAGLFLVFPVIFLFPSVAARVILPDLKNPEMAYVALCLKLLPSGIMGLMIAAMFAATMSVLSAEFNVTASVLTRDIYQRLFRKNAQPTETLWVARIMTMAVGVIVATGALYVEKLGGAFQVNQYLSGIFAIPMIIPVIMGVIFWRPQPWGAIASMVIGIGVGSLLNASKLFSWEMATLIEVVVCIVVFLASGFVPSKDGAYNKRVIAFFKKLATPAPEADATDNAVISGLMSLYAIAFIVTGAMFIVMGIPSAATMSGKLAIGSGVLCLIGAAVFYSNRVRKGTPIRVESKSEQLLEQ
ncbi:sodium transporter [Segetibacter sp. 3557_3]|uniref:sodium:solute symporter family protein n=1 Tax=Segetibacter sp. 3557_3 TaxID=2547429 RepID=UPI00105850F6|nr:sodium:solute symporter family protein [Segetibacter sp. 3557_3]TDH28741.1 sodium transporter [Segetibacter sp. 3557_3]